MRQLDIDTNMLGFFTTSDEAFLEKLRYPVNRKKSSPNSIEDIIDGKVIVYNLFDT